MLEPYHEKVDERVVPTATGELQLNPIALQRMYLGLKSDVKMRTNSAEMRKTVKAGEERVLETLVDFFDWLDGPELQPTTEAVTLRK